jgi:hypothetical protein
MKKFRLILNIAGAIIFIDLLWQRETVLALLLVIIFQLSNILQILKDKGDA